MRKNKLEKILIGTFLFCSSMILLPKTIYAHEHTADCYGGTLHTCQGDTTNGGACYTERTVACQGSMTYSSTDYVYLKCSSCETNLRVTKYNAKCSGCDFTGVAYDYLPEKCPDCGNAFINRPTDATIAYKSPCPRTYKVYDKTCGKTSGCYYNAKGQKITSPYCNYVVTSIAPKNPNQTTKNPDFTIIATYLDGHTSEMKPSSVDYSSGKTYNNSDVILTYKGTVTRVGNSGSLSTTMKLTTPIENTPVATNPPTKIPTQVPTIAPTQNPTKAPTIVPTIIPTQKPTQIPTNVPTTMPTKEITQTPTERPTEKAIESPTQESTSTPTEEPTIVPTQSNNDSSTPSGWITQNSQGTNANGSSLVIDGSGNKTNDLNSSKYYVSDEDEGVEEDRAYKHVEENKEEKISFQKILIIVFLIIFGILILVTIISIIANKIKSNKPVDKINLNDYMRR